MGTKREGRWDCAQCSSSELGRNRTCQKCGAPRPANVKFYLPENAPAITDPTLLKKAQAGPDRLCEYCNSSIPAEHEKCPGCSSAMEKAPLKTDYAAPQDSFPPFTRPSAFHDSSNGGNRPLTRRKSQTVIIATASVAVLSALLFLFFSTKEVSVSVQSLSWQRTIDVQDERTVTEEDWNIPAGGRQKDSWRAFHHNDQVFDHNETKYRQECENVQTGTETYSCGSRDLGNGFFEDVECSRPTYEQQCHDESYQDPVYRDEPVYKTKYRYEIERWFTNRTERATGNDNEPIWPSVRLGRKERESDRTEKYNVTFAGPKKTHEFSVSLEQLKSMQIGQTCLARMNHFGDILGLPDCTRYPAENPNP